MTRHFPIHLLTGGRRIVLSGGGDAIAAKARVFAHAGATLDLFAPEADADLRRMADDGLLIHHPRHATPADLDGAALVIADTGDAQRDADLSGAAQARNIPVNVVDRPDLCTFFTPAIIDRSPVMISIGTGGAAPVLARTVRGLIERALPQGLGAIAAFTARHKATVKARFASLPDRRRFWETVTTGAIADDLAHGRDETAQMRFETLLAQGPQAREGRVVLVGAGPGDPELLTLKAHRLLQEADVIVHDKLVSDAVLDLARRDARRVFVGKAKGQSSIKQGDINDILVREARAGQLVVRLKAGDPFVFGRGGEELERLNAEGIAVDVIPGVTSAFGCAASAHIPLTHRDMASEVTFVTGHVKPGGVEPDWATLGGDRRTTVIYMGVSRAGDIARQMIAGGAPATRPVAVIENGSRPDEKIATGTLARLEALITDGGFTGPAIIVVGEVAALARTGPLPFTLPMAAE